VEVKIIRHGSAEYGDMLQLRIKYLLEPIGVPDSYINQDKERKDLHIGAFEAGSIIGCCVLTPLDNGLMQLRQMVVRTDLQGKGMGGQIVRFAERITREKGCHTMMMHARDPVIEFYEHLGYKIVGEQFFEVGLGHHRMEKQL
jgi:predicted GNAT family N-acyltransferase